MTKAVERLTTGVQSLADLLGLTMPDLPTSATLSKGGLQIVENISSFTVRDEGGSGIWDDDEEKRFYEELPDLKELVPAGLLGIREKAKSTAGAAAGNTAEGGDDKEINGENQVAEDDAEEKEEQKKQKAVEEDIKRQLEQLSLQGDEAEGTTTNGKNGDEEESEPKAANGQEEQTGATAEAVDSGIVGEEEGLQSGPAARLTALFAALPEAVNREMVDKLAVEFAFLNSKAARKRLVKVSLELPRGVALTCTHGS